MSPKQISSVLMSILLTAVIAFSAADVLAAGEACSGFFSRAAEPLTSHAEPSSNAGLDRGLLIEHLEKNRLSLGKEVQLSRPPGSSKEERVQRDAWTYEKNKWLRREKYGNLRKNERALANFTVEIIKALNSMGYATSLDLRDRLKLTVVDRKFTTFRREFDLSEIAADREASIRLFTQIETSPLTLMIANRSRFIDGAFQPTPQGLSIRRPMPAYENLSEAKLVESLKQRFNKLGKNSRDLETGLEAAFEVAELLVRRGFEAEVLPSGRRTFIARVVSRLDGIETPFMKTIEDGRKETGGIFALDPVYYSNGTAMGVVDTYCKDHSINTKRLWESPQDFERIPHTILHEIGHLQFSKKWADPKTPESEQWANGWLWAASNAKELSMEGYPRYFRLDEIPLAYQDARNSYIEKDVKFFRDRSLSGIREVLGKIPRVRELIEKDQFYTFLSMDGNFLFVSTEMREGRRPKSSSGFTFGFRDLGAQPKKSVIRERFLKRLLDLETHLNALRNQIEGETQRSTTEPSRHTL